MYYTIVSGVMATCLFRYKTVRVLYNACYEYNSFETRFRIDDELCVDFRIGNAASGLFELQARSISWKPYGLRPKGILELRYPICFTSR